MGRFTAIGGGTFEDTDALNRRIVALSGKKVPNILFIGTAAQDSTNPLTSCKKSFKRVCPGCIVKKLSIIRNTYTEAEVDELFAWADVIYVGGGNTEYMLAEWQKAGLDKRLLKVFEEDSAVLSGMSAGAICWFTDGYTDSDSFTGNENWGYRFIKPATGLYDAVFCPHYGDFGRHGFDEAIKDLGKTGIALEDCTAFVYDNGKTEYIKSKEEAQAYVIEWQDGKCLKRSADAVMCG